MTNTKDENEVMLNILDFFENAEEEAAGGSSFGTVCRATVVTGYYAMVSGHSKFFPYINAKDRQSVRQQAATYLESVGGKLNKSNPASALQFIRYKDGFLNTSAPKWEADSFATVFHSRRLPNGKVNEDTGAPIFDVTQDYRIFSEGIKNVANEINPLLGKDFWVHYVNVPDPSFDVNDPETHTQYNHWLDAKGEPVANFIPKIVAVFETEEQALAYLEEHGVSTDGADSNTSGGVDELFERVSSQVEMPEGFEDSDMWEPEEYPGLLSAVIKSLVSGVAVKDIVRDYAETPLDKPFIVKVAKLVKEG